MTSTIPDSLLTQLTSNVLERCDEIASCTDVPGEITRLFCTPAMHAAHGLVIDWMTKAGLIAHVDALGNLIGRYESCERVETQFFDLHNKPRICIGSHLDSVRNAGRYDGVLGVVLGIAVIEAIQSLGVELQGAVDIVGFSEEEGVRYSLPYLGSMAIVGKFDPANFDRVDTDGISMRTALETFGVLPDDYLKAKLTTSEYVAYLEAHIEQGPVLEALQQPLSVVESIVGQSRLWLVAEGMAGHAGTLPMRMRRDALAAASDCVLAIEDYAHETEGLVATVGGFHVAPNATNVVPGHVRFSLDVRHGNDSERKRAVEGILGLIHEIANKRNVQIKVVDRSDFEAVPMDSKLVRDLSLCCQAAQLERSDIRSDKKTSDVYVLSSGAGHDAAVMASAMPSVMLFLQSPGGISHHPLESVRPSDVSIAIDAMFRFVVQQLVSRS